MICFICGKSISTDCLRNSKCDEEYSLLQTHFLAAWKNECATSTCQVLFDDKSDYFVDYFRNAEYCSCCEQVIRDLNFTWIQMQSFKNQMLQLSKQISHLISSNYQEIQKKSNAKVVQKRISSFLLQKDGPPLYNLYSCHDMLEIIYSVISSQEGLQKHCTGTQPFATEKTIPTSSEMTHTSEETCESYKDISIKSEENSDPEDSNEIWQENWADIPSSDQVLTKSLEEDTIEGFTKFESIDTDNCYIDDNASEDNSFSATELLPPNRKEKIDPTESLNEKNSQLVGTEESDCGNIETPLTSVHCTEDGCNSYFSTVQKMQRHVHIVHKVEKPYSCTRCPKRYTHNHNLRAHILKVHEKTKLYHSCTFCEKMYENKDDLTLHYSNSHQDPNPFQCAFCPENLEDRETLIKHTNNYHPRLHKDERRMLRCSLCQKRCASKRSLRRHVETLHRNLRKPNKKTIQILCKFCGKKYATEDERTSHYSNAHQEPNPYQCAFCPVLYTNRLDLKKHTSHAHTDKGLKYKCNFCDANLTTFSSFKSHVMRYHELEKSVIFKCSLCALTFPNKQLLKDHIEIHSDCKLMCDDCGNVFKTSKSLMIHKNALHINSHKCHICGLIIEGTQSTFRKHELTHHTIEIGKLQNTETTPKCKFCGRLYKSEEELNLHYSESHQGPNPFNCAFCPEIFSNSMDLRKHTTSVHPDPNVLPKFKCDKCGRFFKSKYTLQAHSFLHNDLESTYRCPICYKYFSDQDRLNTHSAVHSENETICFICETCGKSFKTKTALKTHTKYHDESARNVKCKICDKAFFTASSCKKHEVTHTDIKEFVCEVCGRGFNSKTNLAAHIKIHTGDPSRFRKRKP